MKITGIIAEYNPFHKGHAHQIKTLREQGTTHIVAVMSGNFLQRGTPAICDKHQRTLMALKGGCDLVIELPLPCACAPAFRFADGGVALLDAMGCVDELSFGSECGDTEKLVALSQMLESPDVQKLTAEILAEGCTYAVARQMAVSSITDPATAALISAPNNTLGIEYIRALRAINSDIRPITLPRVGVEHDSGQAQQGYASASLIRRRMRENKLDEAVDWMPHSSAEILQSALSEGRAPADLAWVDRAILSKLRSMDVQQFAMLPDISEGLQHRLLRAAGEACSYEEFLSLVKTKRYPLARLRRIGMAAYLGTSENLCKKSPPYIHVLGFTSAGRELMGNIGECGRLPMSHSLARLGELGGDARLFARAEVMAGDLYRLMLPSVGVCGEDYRQRVIILGDR